MSKSALRALVKQKSVARMVASVSPSRLLLTITPKQMRGKRQVSEVRSLSST